LDVLADALRKRSDNLRYVFITPARLAKVPPLAPRLPIEISVSR
jgi:hypothetical protein